MTVNIIKVAEQVAAHMGDGWRGEATSWDAEEGKTESNRAYLYGPDGEAVFLWGETYPSDPSNPRVEAHGQYPDGAKDRANKQVRIGFGAGKDPKKIAGDITRRLLPEYREELDKACEYIANVQSAAQGRDDAATAITKAHPWLNRTERNNGIELSWYSGVTSRWGDVKIEGKGSTVTINIKNVTVPEAIRMLNAYTEED